ncbi:hypothetical protein [Limnohabitans sp.]|uniref:hypothetical protein n=1 Tax=Limnohabitans sp. TaxID=1907725 RepID=UPI0038B889AB
MSITQFNASYVGDEDRVLFRFNTTKSQEFRLWLTRAIVRDLLTLGAQAAVAVVAREHPPEQAKAIAEFKQQTQAQSAKFTTFTPATQFPLGAEPVLVKRVRFTLDKTHSALEFELQRGQVLTMQLTEQMVGQLRVLLETIEHKAAWDLGTQRSLPRNDDAGVSAPTVSADPKVIH